MLHQKFLQKVISEILEKSSDLSGFSFIIPGKRPVVFIKEILKEKNYNGILPEFFTIDELVHKISQKQEIKGIALWLFAFQTYTQLYQDEDLATFLKWFPTLQKDWDDMLKFHGNDKEILEWMLAEERIKNWGENLGDEEGARKRNLNFWRKMNAFLPFLQEKLEEQQLATSGMIHLYTKENLENYCKNLNHRAVFIGFNAFTPVEEKLVRTLLQWDKADIFFHADEYYFHDERQEAGKFLREYKTWKEFNDSRDFNWIENEFIEPKNIKVYEVSGNIAQTKVLPEILSEIQTENSDYQNTAVVLLDENLLPATLDSLASVEKLNITMGFPLKNLAFSNAMKKLFHLHKQLEKNASSYYYNDILPILDELPKNFKDENIIKNFVATLEERNIVYISKKQLSELLNGLSFYNLFEKQDAETLLNTLIEFCKDLKYNEIDNVQYENISHFEKSFVIIKNQLSPYQYQVKIETLEVLINQLINSESIDFVGEPLEGLQLMGLLETRLLNFENIILLSANEGKLPLGNSQNTYLPFDVRKQFNLHTFLENDGIYAYHFYRFLQNSKNIYLLYNALGSGVNTGEKTRFITQIEMESQHKIEHIIIENTSEPINQEPITIEKTPSVLEKLEEWKQKVSPSHLVTYLYNPIDYYLDKILNTRETTEIEEELSQRNYGTLVHNALEYLYGKIIGKILKVNDLENLLQQVDKSIDKAIERLKHQPEFYEKGMNFVHKQIAKRVVESVLNYDLELVKKGNALEIVALERKIENIAFKIDENNQVIFYGFIDRIDVLNGTLRIIDYKTAKPKNLKIKIKEDKIETLFFDDKYKQAMQLCIYQYCISQIDEFKNRQLETGIWSFAEVNNGVQKVEFTEDNFEDSLVSVKNLILEILNPEIPFTEKVHESWN